MTTKPKQHQVRVMKFGGTSLQNAESIQRVAQIIANEISHGPVVTIVSAMSGVTNRLIEAAQRSAHGDIAVCREIHNWLLEKHGDVVRTLCSDSEIQRQFMKSIEPLVRFVSDLCRGTALIGELTPRALDSISSAGERLCARVVAEALRELNHDAVAVEATELIVTDAQFGQAEPLIDKTRKRTEACLLPILEAGVAPIVTGFIGATKEGILTTLGRGGSDYSATILGAVLDAVEVIIWTDVDGVLTADPRLVSEARILNEISYNEAAELAYFGAKVLHPKTLRPVTEAGIPVWIRNSFAPERPGTKITAAGRPSSTGAKAITAITDVALITLGGRGIVGVSGVVAKVFSATASVNANVVLISQSSSQNDICFVLHTADAEKTVAALRQTFELELAQQKVEHITADYDVAIVAVVGERMRGTLGIAGRTFSALGSAGVNVIAIAQGSSEYNISFVVEASSMKRAVEAVHQELRLGQARSAVSGDRMV